MRTVADRDEQAEAFADIKTADGKGRIALGARFAGQRFAVQAQPGGGALLTPVVVTARADAPITHDRLQEAFAGLEGLTENWDGRGSLAPTQAGLSSAREALALLQAGALARGVAWTLPQVGANERGEITLEWWAGSGTEMRTLTVFVRAGGEIEYLKAWGADIESEMEDGSLTRIADFAALSRWLYGEEGTGEKAAV